MQEKDYERAQQIWSHFSIHTLQEYHGHYLKSGALLLAEGMENFKNNLQRARFNCLHFITFPSLAWTCALKYTERAGVDK